MDLRVKPQKLGRALRRARGERNLTQLELAQELGVAERTIQNWELGETIPRASHRRLILAWLFTEREEATA